MEIDALLISAGINTAVCMVLFSLFLILRKLPSNFNVYYGGRLASRRSRNLDLCMEKFAPSTSKVWETTQDEILTIGGMDAVVFIRMVVFSIRVFSIAIVICSALVLPVNYNGQDRIHKISFVSLQVFTIDNVKAGSKWLWAHCLALYIITLTACSLLYFEHKSITNLILVRITGSPPNPSHFTVLVRAIPWSSEESYSDRVKKIFSNYHASTYLSHKMVYNSGAIQKLKDDAEHMCNVCVGSLEQSCKPGFTQSCFCGGPTNSLKIISNGIDHIDGRTGYSGKHMDARKKECATAFVFFKSRYAALMAAQTLQTSNPMLLVTDLAPEPRDICWSNLSIPYGQLWIRKIITLVASVAFMVIFLIPVTFVQGLTQINNLQIMFPSLTGILKKKFVRKVVTGYLPSAILAFLLCAVPPVMMLFSAVEGSISRSGRKKSVCCKVLYFTIWNVFFVNVFTGSVINRPSVFSSVKDIPTHLAKLVPEQATFFTTYVLSSGWASLACEVVQPYPLLCNLFQRFVLRLKDDSLDGTLSFPYHTEVPKILLFGFLGFTCSILAPLILPFLLFYFLLAYLVYRNQILNVYITKYDGGGQLWPIAHKTTVFSLLFAQVIALGMFASKLSPVAFGFTIPLMIGTLLFDQYCKHRFLPVFRSNSAQVLFDMDQRDEHRGRMKEIYEELHSAYCQFALFTHGSGQPVCFGHDEDRESVPVQAPEDLDTGTEISQKKDRT